VAAAPRQKATVRRKRRSQMERAAISMIEANVTRFGRHHARLAGQMRPEADADLAICE
jgi:hypothetical protein